MLIASEMYFWFCNSSTKYSVKLRVLLFHYYVEYTVLGSKILVYQCFSSGILV